LIEVEINGEDPGFHSLIEELSTEIEPGIVGVKAEGGKQVLKQVKQSQKQVSRLTTLWVDGGFDGEPFMQWVMDFCRWIVQVVLRPEQTFMFCFAQKTLGGGAHFWLVDGMSPIGSRL
jgi:transposase